jgi:hypothetical protein
MIKTNRKNLINKCIKTRYFTFHNLDFQLSVQLMFLMMEFQYFFVPFSPPSISSEMGFFLFASHADKHFKCIFVFKLDFSQHFFHYRMFHPYRPLLPTRLRDKGRKEMLLLML